MKKLSFLIIVLLLLTGCAQKTTPAPSSTAPPAAPIPTTPPTATIPPTPTTPASTACLRGDWMLSTPTAERLLATITSIPSLTILEGALRMRFDEQSFAYHSDDLFLRSSFLDGFLDARANVLIEGNYTTDGQSLSFTQTGIKNELYDWRAVKGESVQPFTGVTPVINFTIPAEGTFSCDGDTLLVILMDRGGATVALDFSRVE